MRIVCRRKIYAMRTNEKICLAMVTSDRDIELQAT